MNKSELRQIIKEEIKNVMNESITFSNPAHMSRAFMKFAAKYFKGTPEDTLSFVEDKAIEQLHARAIVGPKDLLNFMKKEIK